MDGILAIGASRSVNTPPVRETSSPSEIDSTNKDSIPVATRVRMSLPDPQKGAIGTVRDSVELFNAANGALAGNYNFQLTDANRDGRVDAVDAVSEYLLISHHTDPKRSSDESLSRVA